MGMYHNTFGECYIFSRAHGDEVHEPQLLLLTTSLCVVYFSPSRVSKAIHFMGIFFFELEGV